MNSIHWRGAFSLIEVVLAIGVISFCLFTLVNLLGAGLNAGRLSKEDTLLAAAASQVASEVLAETNFTFPATYTFDANGIPVASTSGSGVYQCTVSSISITDTVLLGGNFSVPVAAMVFRWPLPLLRNTTAFYVPIPQS